MHKGTVTIPTTDNNGERGTLASELLRTAARVLARAFGGFTYHRATGGYIMANGDLQTEPVWVLATLTDDEDRLRTILDDIARTIAGELDQESVLTTIEPAAATFHAPAMGNAELAA